MSVCSYPYLIFAYFKNISFIMIDLTLQHIVNLFSVTIPEVESGTQGSRPRPRAQKVRGQGQEPIFRRQTLLRPSKGMLEAKAKNQGYNAQVFSRK